MDFPTIPKELLDSLIRVFPPNPPDEYETLEELRVRAGEQKVINYLRKQYDDQQDNILERKLRT